MTLHWHFFWLSFNSWGSHLSSFFVFPISLKWFEIVVYVTSNSEASSRTVVRGLALTKALNWLLSTSDGQSLRRSSSRLSSLPWNFLNHHCAVRSVVVPGPNASLISQAVFRPSLNWNKKIERICFFSIFFYSTFWKEDKIVLKWL